MEFIVTDRAGIESGVLVRSPYIVISIRDPDKRPAGIPRQSGLKDVLRLAFDDAEPCDALVLPKEIVLMTADQTRQVWQFVRRWEPEVGAVVVHCEQGMSRSPAVAAALCQSYGGDPARFFREHHPNRYVHGLMLKCENDSTRV